MINMSFVDCGSFRGKALTWARKRYGDKCKLYAFECNPHLSCEYGADVTTEKKALWTCDGDLRFYMNIKHPGIEGHSVYKDKTTGQLDTTHPITVHCIDFSKWLFETFSNSDHVIVKMNIEGAEYDVLEKCVETGSINIIKELFVQWHYQKIPGLSKRHEKLISDLNKVSSLKFYNGYGHLKVV